MRSVCGSASCMARKPAQGLGMPPPAISSAEGVLSADTHILCCASMNVISVFCGAHGLVSQLKRAQAERRTSQCAACGVSPCASATTVAVHLRPSTVAKLDAPQKRAHGLLRPRRRLAPSVFHQHLSVLCSGTRAVQCCQCQASRRWRCNARGEQGATGPQSTDGLLRDLCAQRTLAHEAACGLSLSLPLHAIA